MNKKDRVRTVLMEIYNTNRSRSKYRFCIWYMQQNLTIAPCEEAGVPGENNQPWASNW
jgi:hypothetical protein